MARARVPPLSIDSGQLFLQRDPDAGDAWFVDIEGYRQSHVDLTDPTHLRLAYVRRSGHVLDLFRPAGDAIDAVHLGGGGLTLPRYVAATRPRSRQRVFEIDPALAEHVRRTLPLDPRWRIRVRICDAFEGVRSLRATSADAIVSDVYRGGVTPDHLTPSALAGEAVRVLRPGGVFLANVLDPVQARSGVTALSQHFRTVVAVMDHARRRSGGNVVLAATDADLPLDALRQRVAADPVPGRVVTGG